MQPIVPDRYVSHRERIARDRILDAVRGQIFKRRLTCHQILVSKRPLNTAIRARILRGEYDEISLKRAFLVADAVGVDDQVLFKALCPSLAPERPIPQVSLERFEALMVEGEEATC